MFGFIVGTIAGQLAGSWTYWRVRGTGPTPTHPEWWSATAAGLVAAVAAAVLYLALNVHIWLGGVGSSRGLSLFLALCMGICQAVLFRGRPLRPRTDRAA